MSKQVEFLTKLRDGFTMASLALNEYIDTLTSKEANPSELTFNTLRFEPQQGEKLMRMGLPEKLENADWTKTKEEV